MFTSLKKTLTTDKRLSYTKGTANLSFTLTIDKKEDVAHFLDILKEAKKDVEKVLSDLEKK